ncbi:hypothetical protein [Streptomyces tubercidicus]|uniref:hypothetical protein n=1 Tax=Streptomyces tubercidicus TaxID=47759 RepID=UPI0036C17FCF
MSPADAVYRERAHLVALLASIYPSVITPASDLDFPDWWLVYITAGRDQLSWHIAPQDMELFSHVQVVPPTDPRAVWDGHTTEMKYERIDRLAQALAYGTVA